MEALYSRAYTEILEILKYLPEEEYTKIPKEKIDFYKKYKDNNYQYFFDISKPLEEQNISIEANAIIVSLFRDYFATEEQKVKLKRILDNNEKQYQAELREKYNPDNIFKRENSNLPIEIKQEGLLKKIINKIKKY